MAKRPAKKRGRTPGKIYPPEVRIRAHTIYRESGGLASNLSIARQMMDEGFDEIPPTRLAAWKKADKWDTRAVRMPIAKAGEDLRQAILRIPHDDLGPVGAAVDRMATLGNALAERIEAQIGKIQIKTPADLEIAVRALCEVGKTHLFIAKAVSEVRQLRVSSFSGNGEVTPPKKEEPAPADAPHDGLNEAISKWGVGTS